MIRIRPTLLTLLFLVSPIPAQDGYRLPPPEVVALVDAPPAPTVSLSPDDRWMLLVEREAMPSIADLSRPMLRLAGMRIDPAANARYSTSFSKGLVLRDRDGTQEARIPLEPGARVGRTSWSHNSRWFSYTVVSDRGTALWAAAVDSPGQPCLITDRLNGVLGGATWMPDGDSLLLHLVPEDRGPAPEPSAVPAGPNIQETSGTKSPLRTYQDLLTSPEDEALFVHYAVAEIALVRLDGAAAPARVAPPGLYRQASPSPDGRHLLISQIHRPFSYLMPVYSFPHEVFVRELATREDHLIERVPLAENIPIGGVRTGRRSISWKAGEPATLVWTEALDGGDPKVEVPHRDRWLAQAAPFDAEPRELLKVEHRAQGLSYLRDPAKLITREYDRDRRWTRSLLHDLGRPDAAPKVLDDRSQRDRYNDPGRLVQELDDQGRAVLRQDGPWVYRTGNGASPEGLLPFLDRQNLDTLETVRLWRCQPGAYEGLASVTKELRGGVPLILTRHESPTTPPNYFAFRPGSGERVALTDFPDPTPQIRGVRKQLVTYERADGVPLSATLYLPADYREGQRLPLFVWAYPLEYNDPSTAGQIGSSPWRFTRIGGSSHLHLLTQGYAVMDGATMPVIGDPETMNDTFVEQIVASAQAAIDKAVEMGVADRERVAVGGHSYGAFMTANLLARCDLFRAGIARSGAYNRTLTPFGFQSERRTFWEAPEAYFKVSPFMHADKIDEPLLLIHGEADNNSGTFPLQSRRLFQAIKGNGGTARLVMLPKESHGYRARESVLHSLAEMIDWLDRHLAAGQAVPAAEQRGG